MTKERLEEIRSNEVRVREGLARNPIFFHLQSEAAIAAFDDRRDLLAEIDRLREIAKERDTEFKEYADHAGEVVDRLRKTLVQVESHLAAIAESPCSMDYRDIEQLGLARDVIDEALEQK